MTLQERAHAFAAAAHAAVRQTRKYTGEPYICHPEEVARIVESVPHTPEMVAAAYLHDVVEDTGVPFSRIEEEFGPVVADLVYWLTDVSQPSDGNRKARKEKDRLHTASSPAAAQTVKLADLISNARTIIQHDPHFATVFMAEKRRLLQVLTMGDPTLLDRATRMVLDYYRNRQSTATG